MPRKKFSRKVSTVHSEFPREYSLQHHSAGEDRRKISGKVRTTSNLLRMQQTGQLTKRYPIKFRSFLESASTKVPGTETSWLLLRNWPGVRGTKSNVT